MERRRTFFIVCTAIILLLFSFAIVLVNAEFENPIYPSSLVTWSYGPEYGNAELEDPENLVGSSDDEYTHFHTEEWRAPPYGDEAIVVLEMEDWAFGDVYLTGFSAMYETSYVFVWSSNGAETPMDDWDAIGVALLTQGSSESVFVGTSETPFKYIAIFAYAYDPNGQFEFPEENDAYVDCVTAEKLLGGQGWAVISMYALDSQFRPVYGDVSVDGEYAGTTWSEIAVSTGQQHTILVPNSYFSYFYGTGDIGQVYTNPLTHTFTQDAMLGAFYATGGSYWPRYMIIRVAGEEGGTTDPEPGVVDLNYYGENITITAMPDYWYRLDCWVIDEDYENPLEPDNPLIIPAEPCLVEAFFVERDPENFTLTIMSGAHGTTDPEPGNYTCEEDTFAEVESVPDSGYILDYWLLDSDPAGSAQTIYVPMNSSHILQPVFRQANYYNLTISSGSHGTTNPSPGVHQYVETSQVYVTAIPDSNCCFDCWILDEDEEEPYSYDETVSVVMNGDHSLEARFQAYCEVSVYAVEVVYGDPVITGVYCDEDPVGETDAYFDEEWVGVPVVFNVTLGEHELEVDLGGWSVGLESYVGFYSFLIDEEEVFTGEFTATGTTFTIIANYVSGK